MPIKIAPRLQRSEAAQPRREAQPVKTQSTHQATDDLFFWRGSLRFKPEPASVEVQRARARKVLEFARAVNAPDFAPHTEPSGPIGTYAVVNERSLNRLKKSLADALQDTTSPAPSYLKLDDASLEPFLRAFGRSLTVSSLNSLGDVTPVARTILRLFIRALELELNVSVSFNILSEIRWPTDAATAALLRRLVHALKSEARLIRFGSSTLDQFGAPVDPKVETTRTALVPLDVSQTLENYYPSLMLARTFAEQPEFRSGAQLFLRRAALPSDLRHHLEAELNLGHRSDRDAKGDSPAAQHDALKPIEDRRVSGPLGEFSVESGPITEVSPVDFRRYRTSDHTTTFITGATDANIADLNASQDSQPWRTMLWWQDYKDTSQVSHAAVLRFMARRLELHPNIDVQAPLMRAALRGDSVRVSAYGDDAIPALLRLARVVGMSPDEVPAPSAENPNLSLQQRAEQLQLPRRLIRPGSGTPSRGIDEFVVATGPLAESSRMSYEGYSVLSNERFFVTEAIDEHLLELNKWRYPGLETLAYELNVKKIRTPYADVLNYVARRIELEPLGTLAHDTINDLRQPPRVYGDEDIPALLRVAKAVGLAPADVPAPSERDPNLSLLQRAEQLKLPKRQVISRIIDVETIEAFRSSDDQSAKLNALRSLQSREATAPDFSELMAQARALVEGDALTPIEWASLSPQQKKQALAALMADGHLGAATVLAGLFVRGGEADLREALHEQLGTDEAEVWARHAMTIQGLNRQEKLYALEGVLGSPADFRLFELRLALATMRDPTATELKSLLKQWEHQGATQVLIAIIGWAAMRGEAATKEVKAMIVEGLTSNEVQEPDARAALSEGRGDAYFNEEDTRVLMAAAQRVVDAEGEHDLEQRVVALIEEVRRVPPLFHPSEVVAHVLRRMHGIDLKSVIALDEADVAFNGVEGRLWLDERTLSAQMDDFIPRRVDLWSSVETLTGFEVLADLQPEAMSLSLARERYPSAAHALRLLQTKLQLGAAQNAESAQDLDAQQSQGEAQALEIVNRLMGPDLTNAIGRDAKMHVYSAGRTLLEDFSEKHRAFITR